MEHEIKPGSKWAKKSNRRHIATVLWVAEDTQPGGDCYLRFKAPWSLTGELGKAGSSFRAHYDLLPANTK